MRGALGSGARQAWREAGGALGRWAARAQARGRWSARARGSRRGRLSEQALAQGRWALGRGRMRGMSGTVAATRPAPCHDTAGDTATTRQPCARLGGPVHSWACLLGLLGACASGLAF